MIHLSRRCRIALCCSLAFAGLISLSAVPVRAAAEPHSFKIAAGSAADTLREFGRQAKLQTLFNHRVVKDLRTQPVTGLFEPDEALAQMLLGTGLTFERVDPRTVAIRASGSDDHSEHTSGVNSNSLRLAAAEGGDPGADAAGAQSPTVGDDGRRIELEEVVVTGAPFQGLFVQGVIPRTEDAPMPYVVFDRQEIERSGAANISDFLVRNLPAAGNYGTTAQNGLNSLAAVNQTVRLRGLSGEQSVVLINGRRLAFFEGAGANLAYVPLSAIERIEVLPSTASAMYGANAIGGAVNIVTRSGSDGFELAMHYGNTVDSDAAEKRLSLAGGTVAVDGRLNVAVAAEVRETNGMVYGDRGYNDRIIEQTLAHSPGTYFGATAVPPVDVPGNIKAVSGNLNIPGATTDIASVPAGYDGVNRGPGTYAATAGQYNLNNDFALLSSTSALLPSTELKSVYAQAQFDITTEWFLYGDLLASSGQGENQANLFGRSGVTVPASSPFNPFGQAVRISFYPFDVLGDRSQIHSEDDAQRAVVGVSYRPREDWQFFLDYTRGHDDQKASNEAVVTAALTSAISAGTYNPFADLRTQRPNQEAVLDLLRSHQETFLDSSNEMWSARALGKLASLPGGDWGISLGGEWRRQESILHNFLDFNDPARADIATDTGLADRKISAAVLETRLPLVGRNNAKPGLQQLDLAAAVRYEHFSDFGSSTDPMVSIGWRPLKSLLIRAAYSTAFLPPTIFELQPRVGPLPGGAFPASTPFADPRRGNELVTAATTLQGGDPDIDPATSDFWGAGFVWELQRAVGIRFSVDYFRLEKSRAIVTPTSNQILALESLLAGKVVRGPNLPTDPPGFAGPIQQVDLRSFNASTEFTDGFDASLQISWPETRFGIFSHSFDVTYVEDFWRQVTAVSAPSDLVDRPQLGGPARLRGNVSMGWQRNSMNASLTGRYVGAYYSTVPVIEGASIDATYEIDLQAGYRFEQQGGDSWLSSILSGCSVTLGVSNLLDREPPFQVTNGYSLYADPRQRFIYVDLNKEF